MNIRLPATSNICKLGVANEGEGKIMQKKFVKKVVLIRRCWSTFDPPGWALKVTYTNYVECFYFDDVFDALKCAQRILQKETPRTIQAKPAQKRKTKK